MTKSANSKIKAVLAVTLALVMTLTVLAGCNNGKNAISLDETEHTMYIGEMFTLTASAPEGAEVIWSSSNEAVAKVTRGRVTAIGEGTAVITASLESGDSATCTVTVLNRTVTISATTATIDLDSDDWTVTLTASSSDGSAVTWRSSDSFLATVEGGVVTATGANIGTVVITAECGAAKAECVVTIIQPSRPEDWRLLENKGNADTRAVPGTWTYFADGSSADITYSQAPWYGGNAVGVTFDEYSDSMLADGKYFYFRYQPTFGAANPADEVGMEYVMTFTLEISASVEIKYGQNPFKTIKVSANKAKEIVYFGSISDTESFQIRIESASAPLNGVKLTVSDITIRQRTADDVEPEPELPDEPEQPGDVYDLTWGDKGTTVGHPNKWYYMVDSGSGKGEEEIAATPTYDNGVVTLALSSTTAGKTYQLRFQPYMEYGTLYTVTFTINISAQADILVGLDVANKTFTAEDGIVVGQDVTLTYNCYVSSADPFHIELRNFAAGAPITLVVKDVTFVEREADPDNPEIPDDSYNLSKKTNGETVANPGQWAYTAQDDASLNSIPTYKDGVLTMDIASFVSSDTYQFRFQPTFGIGAKFTVTFTVKLESASDTVYFLFGNDYKNSQTWESLVVNEDGTITVTYQGVVDASNPFMIQPKTSSSDEAVAVKITVMDITFTEITESDDPTPEIPDEHECSQQCPICGKCLDQSCEQDTCQIKCQGHEHDLVKRTNGETVANAGEWAYTAPDAANLNSIPTLVDGVLTMDIASFVSSDTYQFRFQPTFGVGAKFTVTFTVKLDSASDTIYFLFGNDYKNSKDFGEGIVDNGDGTVTVTYQGVVDASNPFMIQPKTSSVDEAVALKITVTNISFVEVTESETPTPEIPDEHECSQQCPICGKCLNQSCEKDACQIKCQGHKHECSQQCTICGKCLDQSCDEEACLSKCQGHEHDLVKRTNGETVANAGVWAYTAPDAANLNSIPTLVDGVLAMDIAGFVSSDTYQFRFQPTFGVGAKFTVTFTVKLESASDTVYFLFGNDYKNSKDWGGLVVNEDGTVTVTYQGVVDASNPFMIQPKTSSIEEAVALKITVTNITFVENIASEEPAGDSYDIEKAANNAAIRDGAGKWYYKADGEAGTNYQLASTPRYEDGTITWAFISADDPTTKNYQLGYQPEWETGTSYTVKLTVTVSAACKINYGSDYQPYVFDEAGTYEVTWTGTVGDTPFLIALKNFTGAITLTVSDISIELA